MSPFRIHGDPISGNCLKVKDVADALGLAYEWVDVDVVGGECRTPAFRALAPMGQVPVAAFDDGRTLAQSNAIIRYLARGSALLPEDPFAQAKVDEWLFWEQYSHEPYIAVCRFQMRYLGKGREEREAWRVERGEAALDFLESQLSHRAWLAGDAVSIADVALRAYTQFAQEGGFSLEERPAVREWIVRVRDGLGTMAPA